MGADRPAQANVSWADPYCVAALVRDSGRVISLERVAAWAALVGGALWLVQGIVLVARGGVEPDPRIEAVTFSCGFVGLVVAAGLAAWVSSAARSRAARVRLAVLAALSVPFVVFVGQAVACALPGSHWLESDVVVIVLALVAVLCGIRWLRRGVDVRAQ